ncbi:Golgi apparatus protein 1-like [Penaeus monodon]|uniref:Golgi apparatus protein 1-like n=1 Tax=Penaeus monodon TaxID=6687 RepID=UPI0018A7B65C|nr:Golgi apparatus protein 1-like [Penaeus monodon]
MAPRHGPLAWSTVKLCLVLCACGVALASTVPKRSKFGSDGGGGEGMGRGGERGGRGTEMEGRAAGGGGRGGSPKGRSSVVKLIEEPDCKEDIERICRDNLRNNFAVLECLQNERRDIREVVSDKCNHLLWTYKVNLTRSGKIEDLAKGVCEDDMQNIPACKGQSMPGHTISCMTEKMDEIKDERCRQYLLRLEAIVFSDYRLVENMMNDCQEEIANHSCGRVQVSQEGTPHSQGDTIECLSTKVLDLRPACRKQILRLAELQADDFHLDRALFFACREDREKFCEKTRAGEGRVYKCLMKHKMERGMSKECVEQMTRRQKLMVRDYQVSRGLVRACRSAISENQCRRGLGDHNHDVKLSHILLCLEEAEKKAGKDIERACKEEMLTHRRMLMEDYQLSPDLLVDCSKDISQFCHDGIETGGRTLHCLMKHAHSHNQQETISDLCKRRLQETIKQSDAGEDWRADPVLYEACYSMVESNCRAYRGGNARVLRCLMQHLDSPEMPTACEAALLEIQYFIARDWRMDPALYAACSENAERLCGARRSWFNVNTSDPEGGGKRRFESEGGKKSKVEQVLPCLFRYVYHPSPKLRLNSTCAEEVQRVMQERAAHVDLHPEIERVCMGDLGKYCSSHTGPGEEIACLQDNMEMLERECKKVVGNYTEAEAKNTGLNAQLTMQCASVIPQVCGTVPQPDTDGALMECLIRHKNTELVRNNHKCRAVIEHFQLLALKDYTFSPKFKESCQSDVASFCDSSKLKNKADVIECLSTQVRDAVLSDDRHKISKACRHQLRQQLMQRHENIRLDPKLQQHCSSDVTRFCKDVSRGRGAVLECLRQNKQSLSGECHKVVFLREEEEQQDPGTDVVLVSTCKQMIQQYCYDIPTEQYMSCLKKRKNELNFDPMCRQVVVRRMVEQTTDVRLNPDLYRACRIDMTKFCFELLEKMKKSNTEINGKLTECLKEQLPTKKLSATCKMQVLTMARSSALDYNMDPILLTNCKDDMNVLCHDYLNNDGGGKMEECLKLHFDNGRLQSEECKIHIAHVIDTQRADIHVDPILNEACGIDDNKYCEGKEKGQHLACLLDVLERNPNGLKEDCSKKLRDRKEMFSAAYKISHLKSFEDIVNHVSASPERNYILLVFVTAIGIIFVGGLFCGRATKRYKLLKDR